MEPALVDAFVEQIEREHQQGMVLGAMGLAIPFLAIAAIFTGS